MLPPLKVVAFTPDEFFLALSNVEISKAQVALLGPVKYLLEYLKRIGAKTLVLEENYTDGDYLDDFASYYVRCHADYSRRCKRLHFFTCDISDSELRAAIRCESQEVVDRLQGSYLGFIVSRPLPEAIIGRTVLATYDSDGGRRNYPCVRPYAANLFGIDLQVTSLAYQEQDTVVAACATVALWCAFHKTSDIFKTTIPRLARITSTGNAVLPGARPLPSHGLNLSQICNVVRSLDLEPEVVSINEGVPLASLIYGHLRMGLPVVLGAEVESRGLHAITIVGYSLQPNRVHVAEVGSRASVNMPMIGLRIDSFYAHDDQIGPFCKIKVEAAPPPATGMPTYPIIFRGSWVDNHGTALALYPKFLIIPVYHKIRVTWLDVQTWITRFTNLACTVLGLPSAPVGTAQPALEWDLHLATINEYKRELRNSTSIDRDLVEAFALAAHPRFIWRATLRFNSNILVEFLADATGMARSFPLYNVIWHNTRFRDQFALLSKLSKIRPLFESHLTPRFLEFLLQKIPTTPSGSPKPP